MVMIRLNGLKVLWSTRTREMMPIWVGAIASIAVLVLWHQLSIEEERHIEQLIQQEASIIQRDLTHELTERIQALKRMATHWEVSGGQPQSIWEADATAIAQDFYGFQAIEWADSSYRVRWVVPQKGNEAAQNFDLRTEPRRESALRIAHDLRQPFVTRTIALIQGGKGFLVAIPMFVGDRFDGFVIGVFQIPFLFDGILTVPKGYQIHIYDGQELIYSQGLPSPSQQHKTVWVAAYGIDWQVDIFPTPALLHQVRSPLPTVVLITGLGSAWLFALVLHFAQLSDRRSRQFEQTNRQLQWEIQQRQQIEAALQISQSRFAGILAIANDAIISIDINQRITLFNQGAERIFGYSAPEVLGQPLSLLMSDPVSHAHRQSVAEYARSGGNARPMAEGGAIFGRRKDGSEFPAEASISKLDLNGEIIFTAFLRDITARQQAEAELREMSEVMANAVSGISQLDGEGRYLYVNKAYASITGYQPDEMIGMNWQKTVHPDDLATVIAAYQQMLQEGRVEVEARGIRRDGSVFYKQLVMIFKDQQHQGLGHYCFMKDISDRKQAEEALRHQKELFQIILEHLPVMIALINEKGGIEFINPEIERTLGWSLEDWGQQDVLAQCYPDASYRQRVLEHIIAATGTWDDMRTRTAQGTEIETTWANVRLSNGYILGIGQDISDRKRIESELRQAMEAASAANHAKSLFLANMSHELRTPLNVILGFAQVMARDTALTSSQQEDLLRIRRSGDHLLSLINDVLDFSKIEAGRFTLEETKFDLVALLDTVQSMLLERAESKGLSLHLKIAPQVPPLIQADAQKLRQVVINLMSNAIKFTEQGSVTLSVTLCPEQPDTMESGDANPLVILQFEVTDTGIGMAPEELTPIFDAFFQAQGGRKTNNGTGLGLTISRKLVELMGGKISVRSLLGQGSTFTFTIPVRPTHDINPQPVPSDRIVVGLAPDQGDHRILVVDDQAENRLLLVRILTQLGLDVREALNGAEAVQVWETWHPEMIWMDLRMPVLDGYEATQQIRALEAEPKTIIIALTAQASQSDRALAFAAGCNDYISKPFREEMLFLKMAEHLGLRYIYAQAPAIANPPTIVVCSNSDSDPSTCFDPAALNLLPSEWFLALENASLCGNDFTIRQLVAQLPSSLATLGTRITELADQYQFEEILELFSTFFARSN